ncbi:transcriptional regulator [Longibacter salinarum]|uniref:Transcriptional regulator n=1 Tax=Longibacter salinarum TaxID=1850348 RepID=A0A2A8D2L5_9BACT|nr:ArsR family transcriptional regulator [Longibacter salinarum]PEN14898.1 transcriptional regulator [Longibacter salinarum]
MSALDLVSSDTRRELLRLVKQKGSLSLDEGMEALGMARTTVREHLLRLERKGLVERSTVRSGRGRPSLLYTITAKANVLFPTRDDELMNDLLTFLNDQGAGDLVTAFFESYWGERTERVERRLEDVGEDDVDARVELLRDILEEEGFMPKIDRTADGITIRECNCPFPESVKQTQVPCNLEVAFYESVLGVEVERSAYIPSGDAACTYHVDTKGPGEA